LNLLEHPADIGRLAIGVFASDEQHLIHLHIRLIEFFEEVDGTNVYVLKSATDLARHLRYIFIGKDRWPKEQLNNGVDFVMSFYVLEWFIERFATLSEPYIISLIDLLAGDPRTLLNRHEFEKVSKAEALRRFHSGSTRPNSSGATVDESVYMDYIQKRKERSSFPVLKDLKP